VWLPALAEAGLTELHLHDLRHTGNDLTAAIGAALREMMDRYGPQQPSCRADLHAQERCPSAEDRRLTQQSWRDQS
jgi:predicted component of type VI protein secretion system